MKFTYNQDDGFETILEFGRLTVSGNEEKGFRPFQLMVSSIAVCSASVLRKVLTKQRMVVHDIQVEADVTRDPGRANRLSAIKLHYVIMGDNLTEEKVEKAVKLSAKNCPMAQTVSDTVAITETFELH
ncbi:OsmC family protein [Salipaludibacillus sp. LMS25]|jgi:uncharacterized OsmC-like protein|uniref:OsmC family protein n=1 Tax=Salipaludibacillus sp. LMS25 TaxID=2924031 RepID=UPI0020D13C1F|nr:OsmC family protein [Salipaludibacillus sp. LMS25]UTR13971.1 OsmC family protein [Salipaludibacillus sp. LMS25]